MRYIIEGFMSVFCTDTLVFLGQIIGMITLFGIIIGLALLICIILQR